MREKKEKINHPNRNYNKENIRRDESEDDENSEIVKKIINTILTESPNVHWKDIVGLKNVKQKLKETFALSIVKPELFNKTKKSLSGILLYGPPGCGKTLLAKAIATEYNFTFFNTSNVNLLSKWLRESKKLIISLFKVARKKAPSVIYIDYIDGLASKCEQVFEGESIKAQLLNEIKILKSFHDRQVFVLSETNKPWNIDDEMINRLEKRIYVPPPDLTARVHILKIHIKGVKMDLSDEDFVEIALKIEGYSGSDISTLCREVSMLPLRELDTSKLMADSNIEEEEVRAINMDDFTKSIKEIKPSASKLDLREYEKWKNKYGE